ncbi:MAG: hypothetical protein ABIY48_10085 [Acidimicrobiales bacterium]
MLMFERRVVAELTTSADPQLRGQVEQWVDGTLQEMSDVLRLGVVLESLLLTAWAGVRRPCDLHGLLGWLDRSPISLLRSYPRLFRSLVLFGELELADADRR